MTTTINKLDDSNPQSQNSFSSVAKNSFPKSPTNNLDVSAATYLGGKDDDFTNAVDISVDGNFVIVGGSLKNANLGGEETELLGGGDGTIVRYNAQTNEAVATTHLPGKILDLEVSKNGDIAVAYEGGIAVLNADATEVKWSKSLSDVARIAISDNGKVETDKYNTPTNVNSIKMTWYGRYDLQNGDLIKGQSL